MHGRFFETGKTPIDDSPKALPDIKPSHHLIGSALLSFSKLYEKFRNTSVNLILSAFFIAQLFREITDSDNLSIEQCSKTVLSEIKLILQNYVKVNRSRSNFKLNLVGNCLEGRRDLFLSENDEFMINFLNVNIDTNNTTNQYENYTNDYENYIEVTPNLPQGKIKYVYKNLKNSDDKLEIEKENLKDIECPQQG